MEMNTPADLPAPDQAREARLSAFLARHGLCGQIWRHPPVFTTDEARQHCAHIPGAHLKNLVIKDKRGGTGLVVVSDRKRVDLKALAPRLNMGRLSFVKPEAMTALLGVEPGSVTPLAVINAPVEAGTAPLTLAIDRDLWDAPVVVMHLLHNRASIALSQQAWRTVLQAAGYTAAHRVVTTIPTRDSAPE